MNVLFLSEIQHYLYELENILYAKGYYSYESSAHKYVDNLINDIKTNVSKLRHRPAPEYYDKYGKGMYYAFFPKNRRTTWYAFFTKYEENGETVYLIRYIGNNHTEAQHL